MSEIVQLPRKRGPKPKVAPPWDAGIREPTRYEAANAVAEAASREIQITEGLRDGTYIGGDPKEREAIAWRARCLVAAHKMLRAKE